jgi:hypothetical protein
VPELTVTPHSPPLMPKLLGPVRQAARLKHFSLRTERAYAQWVSRFVVHHGKRRGWRPFSHVPGQWQRSWPWSTRRPPTATNSHS